MDELGGEKKDEFHAGVFCVVAAHKFLFAFLQIKGQTSCFRERGNDEDNKPKGLRQYKPPGFGLRLDDHI